MHLRGEKYGLHEGSRKDRSGVVLIFGSAPGAVLRYICNFAVDRAGRQVIPALDGARVQSMDIAAAIWVWGKWQMGELVSAVCVLYG